MWYNVRIKTFPDGHKQYFYSEEYILRDIPDEYKRPRRKKYDVPGSELKKRFKRNMNRAVNQVYDLARSNHFDWFITMTFSPECVDRSDYNKCSKLIRLFTKRLQRSGNKWIIVPELHKDGKSYHFHGLVQGELDLTYWKDGVYNLNNFEWGYTTAMKIEDPARVATYIAKYLTKDIQVPKGRKCYWASQELVKPEVEYVDMPELDFACDVYFPARYVKEINGEYGRFIIAEE